MCGIAGFLNFDGKPADRQVIARMTAAIAHRGPDGEGFYIDGGLGLGHRRLAIIDLSDSGRQPMALPGDEYVVVYNGEIYNFAELRVELEALGCRFVSRSDTEVILHAWKMWGPRAVERFNGMFAFALWHPARRKLFLARDRVGQKPLYFGRFGNTFAFGSEVKALLAVPGAAARLDPAALVEYLTFQNFFGVRTLFAGVSLMPAGCWMEIDASTGGERLHRYWNFDFREPAAPKSPDSYRDELDVLFRAAVRRHLIAEVDVNAYLSGGIDSGAIAALASSQLPHMRTFTVGFDLRSASGLELAFDEREAAEFMSYLFKTEHYEMVLKSGDLERVMPALTRHIEEPRVGQSYPNYYAAGLASRFGKVVLGGAGGDELFGGYPWRYFRSVADDGFESYIDAYYAYWQRMVSPERLPRLLAPIWGEGKHVSTRDIFKSVFADPPKRLSGPADYINFSLYFEAKTFLHGLLIVEDKLSMAHGLEARMPFLDNDVIDFAQRVPVGMKLSNLGAVGRIDENVPGNKSARFYSDNRDGKLILRDVLSRYVPESVTQAPKRGFSAPDASWFRGESIDYVRRTLLNGTPMIADYLDMAEVRSLVNDHLEGRENRRLLIWSLLSLENWCRNFTAPAAGAAA